MNNPYIFSFPHPLLADDDGFLCVGGDLHPSRLLTAYQYGIFPWYSEDQPILWWFTSPRMVLYPSELKVSKSMRNVLNRDLFRVTYDTAFPDVIAQCKRIYRPGQGGTWISDEMMDAYIELHDMGHAHSVEVWDGELLVGGLYGIILGKIFYGESMFAHTSNASKVGFIHLVRKLESLGFELIDCQQETPHLTSLGARLIDGTTFLDHLRQNALVGEGPIF